MFLLWKPLLLFYIVPIFVIISVFIRSIHSHEKSKFLLVKAKLLHIYFIYACNSLINWAKNMNIIANEVKQLLPSLNFYHICLVEYKTFWHNIIYTTSVFSPSISTKTKCEKKFMKKAYIYWLEDKSFLK